MKQIFIVFFLLCTTNILFSQEVQELQTTWLLTDLYVGEIRFEEADTLCMYQTELTILNDSVYEIYKPCEDVNAEGVYVLQNDALYLDEYLYSIKEISNDKLILSMISALESDDFTEEVTITFIYTTK